MIKVNNKRGREKRNIDTISSPSVNDCPSPATPLSQMRTRRHLMAPHTPIWTANHIDPLISSIPDFLHTPIPSPSTLSTDSSPRRRNESPVSPVPFLGRSPPSPTPSSSASIVSSMLSTAASWVFSGITSTSSTSSSDNEDIEEESNGNNNEGDPPCQASGNDPKVSCHWPANGKVSKSRVVKRSINTRSKTKMAQDALKNDPKLLRKAKRKPVK